MKNIINVMKKSIITLGMIVMMTAAADPTASVNKLSTLFKTIISSVGIIMLLFSVVKFGIAFKQRDNAAISESLLGVVGGIVIATAPYIVDYVIG